MTVKPKSATMITFDEKRHEYRLDDKPVPSVTTIISNVSEDLMLNSSFIRAGARGTMVHEICDKIKLGKKVNLKALGDEIRPYVEGYVKYMKDNKFTLVASEKRVFSVKHRFAGTVDDVILNDKGLGVFDIKTSAVISPLTKLQTSAYAHCIDEMKDHAEHGKVKQRGAIWLTGDGDYEIQYFNGKDDFNIFLCHLTVHNWKRREGLK